jgi:predicted flap endonuclease-1-like 5' DNA nuclease
MTYLLTRYLLWLALAAALGLLVARFTWRRRPAGGAMGAVLMIAAVFAAGVCAAMIQAAPGRPGHWLEVGLLLLAAYLFGWLIGEWLWRALAPSSAPSGEAGKAVSAYLAGRTTAPLAREGAAAPPGPQGAGAALRPMALVQPDDGGDDLRSLDVTPAEARALAGIGVWRIGQIASWRPAHARWIADQVGAPQDRVADVWIPRARQAMDDAFARASSPPPSIAPVAGEELERIVGIGPAAARSLAGWGVTRLADVAAWSADDAAYIGERLGEAGRVEREMWVEQARLLAAGVETTGSLAKRMGRARTQGLDAPLDDGALARLRTEIEELSEAAGVPVFSGVHNVGTDEQGLTDEAVPDEFRPALLTAPPTEGADDLKLIWGVGPKLEARLNEIGVYRFAQIAEWSDMNLRWVDQHLFKFKGRAVRDRWIEQARKLAGGWRPESALGERPEG